MLTSALVGVVAAAVAVPLFALGSNGSHTAPPQVSGHRTTVGTYELVTHGTAGPNIGQTVKATFRIKTYNPKSGAITGTVTGATKQPRIVFAVTGTVTGRDIRMRAVFTPALYTAHLRGRIRANGTVIGTETDNEGTRARWTMTRR